MAFVNVRKDFCLSSGSKRQECAKGRMKIMQRMVSIILICLGIGTNIWAQQEHTPSSDQINQLLKRIEALEQTVHELREQIQSKDTPKGNPPEAATVTIAQPLHCLLYTSPSPRD